MGLVSKSDDEMIARRLTPSDRPFLRRWLKDPVVRAAIEDETVQVSEISKTVKLFEESDPFRDGALGLILSCGHQRVGFIYFVWINWISRNAEVVVFVGPENLRRSSTAFRVILKVGETAFRHLNLHKIYAFVYGENRDALKVFRRILTPEVNFKNYILTDKGHDDLHLLGMLSGEYDQFMKRWEGRF